MSDNSQKTGKVSVQVCVDSNGDVSSADYTQKGSDTADGQLRQAENGIGFLAMKCGAWVVPAYIQGSYDAMPRGTSGVRMKPVNIYYGEPFLATEEKFGTGSEAYMAVSGHIMEEIKKQSTAGNTQQVQEAIEKAKATQEAAKATTETGTGKK